MTVYDPSWKQTPTSRSRVGRTAFLGYMLLLIVLWMSHSNLSAKIPAESNQVGALGLQLATVQSQVEQIESVVGEHSKDLLTIKLGEVQRTPGVIALDNHEAQIIGQGFAVTRLEIEPLGKGIFVRGRIINLQAVTHEDLIFRITVGQESTEFTAEEIEAGESRPFSVFVPSLALEQPRYARIDYRESTIWHRATQ